MILLPGSMTVRPQIDRIANHRRRSPIDCDKPQRHFDHAIGATAAKTLAKFAKAVKAARAVSIDLVIFVLALRVVGPG
jgi:hypothetical protein